MGSGVSKSSGILTGWEIVEDLIRKIAKLEGENCEPDPIDWYKKKYLREPDYSQLLNDLAKTETERQQLLRGYFEPTEEERRQGLKLPNAAHKAIAALAAAGYLRVILTTNFDRLIENALEQAGITPTLITSTDQLSGAPPLTHSGVTVIKLHGDYRDTRIKNTPQELEKYDGELNRILDQIFDEYGLIVSGWSAEWDIALRSAIQRCPSRRFTTFWGTRSELTEKAKALVQHRRAQIIKTQNADELFTSLSEKVQALADLNADHPLSAKIAAETVKRYLPDPSSRIRLRDLIHKETEKTFREAAGLSLSATAPSQESQEVLNCLNRYGALCEVLLSVFVVGCYFGGRETTPLWVGSLQRIANLDQPISGDSHLIILRRYPALLLLYGAGIAAVAAKDYETLSAILTQPKVRHSSGEKSLCLIVNPEDVMYSERGKCPAPEGYRGKPFNRFLFEKLREPLREFLPSDRDYEHTFDQFEYLLGLVYADLKQSVRDDSDGLYGPSCLFIFRDRSLRGLGYRPIFEEIDAEITAGGENWPLLKAGLFERSVDRLKKAKVGYDNYLKWLSNQRWGTGWGDRA